MIKYNCYNKLKEMTKLQDKLNSFSSSKEMIINKHVLLKIKELLNSIKSETKDIKLKEIMLVFKEGFRRSFPEDKTLASLIYIYLKNCNQKAIDFLYETKGELLEVETYNRKSLEMLNLILNEELSEEETERLLSRYRVAQREMTDSVIGNESLVGEGESKDLEQSKTQNEDTYLLLKLQKKIEELENINSKILKQMDEQNETIKVHQEILSHMQERNNVDDTIRLIEALFFHIGLILDKPMTHNLLYILEQCKGSALESYLLNRYNINLDSKLNELLTVYHNKRFSYGRLSTLENIINNLDLGLVVDAVCFTPGAKLLSLKGIETVKQNILKY